MPNKPCGACGKVATRELKYRHDVKKYLTSFEYCCGSQDCVKRLDDVNDAYTRVSERNL